MYRKNARTAFGAVKCETFYARAANDLRTVSLSDLVGEGTEAVKAAYDALLEGEELDLLAFD